MTVPITETQFYDALRQLEDKLSRKIDDRANRIEQKLDSHAADDREAFDEFQNRILTIEIERDGEKAQTVKRGSLVALVVTAGTTVIIEIAKRMWK